MNCRLAALVTSLDVQSIDELNTVAESAAKTRLGAIIGAHDPLMAGSRVRIARSLSRRVDE